MTLPPQGLDDNAKFIIAGAINLYRESLRRIPNRVLLAPSDIDPLFAICEELIKPKPMAQLSIQPQMGDEERDEEEEQQLLTALEQKVERRA